MDGRESSVGRTTDTDGTIVNARSWARLNRRSRNDSARDQRQTSGSRYQSSTEPPVPDQEAGYRPGVRHPAPAQRAAGPPAGRVLDPGRTHLDDPPGPLAQAEAEVDVLRSVEERLVDPADAVERDTAEQLAGAAPEVDVPPGSGDVGGRRV